MVECLPGHMNVVQEHPFNLSKTSTPVKFQAIQIFTKATGGVVAGCVRLVNHIFLLLSAGGCGCYKRKKLHMSLSEDSGCGERS